MSQDDAAEIAFDHPESEDDAAEEMHGSERGTPEGDGAPLSPDGAEEKKHRRQILDGGGERPDDPRAADVTASVEEEPEQKRRGDQQIHLAEPEIVCKTDAGEKEKKRVPCY